MDNNKRSLEIEEASKLGQLKHHVFIFMPRDLRKRQYKAFCSGTIISVNKVVSAARCFLTNRKRYRVNLSTIQVVAAILHTLAVKPDVDGTQQWRSVKTLYSPRYFRYPANNIALILVDRPWVFDQFVGSVPHASVDFDFDGVCIGISVRPVSSWSVKSVLYKRYTHMITNKRCEATLVRNLRRYICTGSLQEEQGVKVDEAVRGGGLICHETGDPVEDETAGVLVGVHSLLNNKLVTLHTRVAMFNKWIEDSCGVVTALELLVASLFVLTLMLS